MSAIVSAPYIHENNGVFEHIDASYSLEQWDVRLSEALKNLNQSFKGIIYDESIPTIENTFIEMERIRANFAKVVTPFFTIYGAHTLDSWVSLNDRISGEITEMMTRFFQNDAFYQRCRLAADQVPESIDEATTLLIHNYMLSFRNSGMELDEKVRPEIIQINSTLESKFNEFNIQNTKNGNDFLVFTKDELKGLPENLLNSFSEVNGDGETVYHVSLQVMVVDSVLTFIENRSIREKLFTACSNRGFSGRKDNTVFDTRPILNEVMALRQERSKLLGYSSVTEYLLSDTMAESYKNVIKMFQNALKVKLPKMKEELNVLAESASKDGIDDLMPWDLEFYLAKVRNERYTVDESLISEYLALDNVISGAFMVAGRLFDLTFNEVHVKTYHELVKTYLVEKNGVAIGYFSTDFHVRPEKGPGAWMTEMHPYREEGQLPWIINVCNFPESVNNEPVLISFEDAVTVFHELGHALHGLLSFAKYPSQWGTSVMRDFVELPSQLLENWMTSSESLRLFARHYQTNEPIPEKLLNDLLISRDFGDSISFGRYCHSAIQDMLLHQFPHDKKVKWEALENYARSFANLPKVITPRHRFPHFSHIFSSDGYASQYYCYHWAKVLEESVFECFKKHGVFNKELANKLEELIYSTGGSRPPEALFQDFLKISNEMEVRSN